MVENVIQVKNRSKNYVDVEQRIMSMWVEKSKKRSCVQKDYIWNPSACTCESGKYYRYESIVGDSVITWEEIREVARTVPTKTFPIKAISRKIISTNFNEKRGACEIEIFYSF